MANWMDQLKVNPPQEAAAAPATDVGLIAMQLRDAAARYAKRPTQDDFTTRSIQACIDIADKLDRFGSFASDNQRGYAEKLVKWSQPRTPQAPSNERTQPWGDGNMLVPGIFAVMSKLSTLRFGALKISRKNQDTLCWLVWNGALVGRIADGSVTVFPAKAKAAGVNPVEVVAELQRIEADPLRAAKEYGHRSGNCCVCGRDLTDPDSISAGIGPICAGYF